jgi:hypothetical protein
MYIIIHKEGRLIMINDKCECCGKKLKIAFSATKFCSNCSVSNRDKNKSIYCLRAKIKKRDMIIDNLKKKIVEINKENKKGKKNNNKRIMIKE